MSSAISLKPALSMIFRNAPTLSIAASLHYNTTFRKKAGTMKPLQKGCMKLFLRDMIITTQTLAEIHKSPILDNESLRHLR